MASKIAHHELDRPLKMQKPDGEKFAIQVSQVSIQQNDGETTQCILTFHVSYDRYQKIDQQALFNLQPELRGAVFGGHLDPASDVEIEAALQPHLIAQLNEQAPNVRAIVSYLFDDCQTQPSHPLLNTENWLGLYVKQAITLPPELAEETQGELKVGYQTKWVGLLSDLKAEKSDTLLQTVMSFFQSKSWKFVYDPAESSLTLEHQGENGQWELSAITSEDDQFCLFYSTFPQIIPLEKHLALAEFLTRANYGLPIGNFEFNLDSGEIRYKTSLEVSSDELTLTAIERLVDANIFAMDAYILGLRRLLEENVTPLEVLSDLED